MMSQERLMGIEMLSIENEILAESLDFDEIPTDFAARKSRKVAFK